MTDGRSSGETDYFAWTKTGHLDLALGILLGLFNGALLVVSHDRSDERAVIVNGLFVALGVFLLTRGARRLTRPKRERQ